MKKILWTALDLFILGGFLGLTVALSLNEKRFDNIRLYLAIWSLISICLWPATLRTRE